LKAADTRKECALTKGLARTREEKKEKNQGEKTYKIIPWLYVFVNDGI
jgi:hypothetical protein